VPIILLKNNFPLHLQTNKGTLDINYYCFQLILFVRFIIWETLLLVHNFLFESKCKGIKRKNKCSTLRRKRMNIRYYILVIFRLWFFIA